MFTESVTYAHNTMCTVTVAQSLRLHKKKPSREFARLPVQIRAVNSHAAFIVLLRYQYYLKFKKVENLKKIVKRNIFFF